MTTNSSGKTNFDMLGNILARSGSSNISTIALGLLILAAAMQPLFLIAAVLEEEFKVFYEPATFPSDQWLRPIAAIVIVFALLRIRERAALIMVASLTPWLVGLITNVLVSLLQGGVDRWVDIASSETKPFAINLIGVIETFSLTIAFLIGATWLFASQIGSRLAPGNSVLKVAQWMVAPSGSIQGEKKSPAPLRKSQIVLVVALFFFAAAGLLKMVEPFSSGYFDVTYPGGELPADQWLRVIFYLAFVVLTVFGISMPTMLPILGAFAFIWNTFLETPIVLISNQQRDRLANYNSVGFEALNGLLSIALVLVVLTSIWVIAEGLILQYKRRVMAWAESRADHYAGVDLPVAAHDVKQQVSTLAVFGLIFSFLIPIVGLILSYAARNDIVLSKGHKTGFDMAVTASIIGWALLIVQILALIFLTFTGALASVLPWLFSEQFISF
jgi:type III secretory pathway component EscS